VEVLDHPALLDTTSLNCYYTHIHPQAELQDATLCAKSRKGQILEYNLDSKTFNIFGLPDNLSSLLGIAKGMSFV
jgi:hypothetical protein